MNIPLIDLKAHYASMSKELDSVALEVLSSAAYIMGRNVTDFEKKFAKYIGTRNAISVGNGTDALIIALKALGIGEGDEVITATFTYFASAECISAVGARPVFVDVEKDTFNIDPSKIEEKISKKTKAIIPVHIFGQSADMDEINKIAKKYNLKVIEDACQAVGAKYKNNMIGTLSDVACYSFFPTKNLSCAGDGGMIVTNNDEIATIAKALRTHGSGETGQKAYNLLNNLEQELETSKDGDDTVYNPLKYYNYLIGFNSRLDAIQAAILSAKLPHLDKWNARRREIAKLYDKGLSNCNVTLPTVRKENESIYHQYVLQCEDRKAMLNKLKERGIATGIYYPIPLHLQKVYKDLGYKKGDMPVAEYLSERTFAIPVYPELNDEQINYIIDSIKNV